jgi:feruloyl esterase
VGWESVRLPAYLSSSGDADIHGTEERYGIAVREGEEMMHSQVRQRVNGLVLCTVLLWGGAGLRTAAATSAPCTLSALQVLAPAATTLTAVTRVPATTTLPEYCQVDGYVTTPGEPGEADNQVNFRVGLPTAWNHKFYFQGCGGRCGSLVPLDAGLTRGYASATTDTGHQAAVTDSLWAYNARTKEIDYGHRGIHVTTVAAKLLTQAYYGRPLRQAYFNGCSNGGRQALIEAQRYPEDFHGIIAGDPSLGTSGSLSSIWRYQTVLADRDHYLPATKLSLLANAVLADCDVTDGLVDGLIDDPRQCTFDPVQLLCPAGTDAPDCLTAGQVETVWKIYAGPTNSAGEQLYPGYPMGHEDDPTGWQLWIVGSNPDHVVEQPDGTLAYTGTSPLMGDPPLGFAFLDDGLKYLSFEQDDPTYSYRFFNFDTDPPLFAFMGEILNATDPQLVRFKAYGGKLIMYHGWADPAISALRTIEYSEEVVQAIGGKRQTDQFFRLFLAPGMHHCSGGPGPNTFDTLTALETWVEDGIAPTRIIASHSTGGVVDRTRPLCPYPQVARYVGTGSIDQAQNFLCTPPAPAP